MMAALCVAPLRMEHEMDEEEVAVALGRQQEGGEFSYLGEGDEQTNEGPPGASCRGRRIKEGKGMYF